MNTAPAEVLRVRYLLIPVTRLIDALIDPARRERVLLVTLAAYTVIWTLYGVIAKASQDMQLDATEIFMLAHEPAFGYAKHPPLAPWLARAWFSVFPASDWAYYFLAMVYVALGLWVAWHLFGRLLTPAKLVVALACLMMVPYFNFHALRFNHNAVLGTLWAATALCYIRSFETRKAGWAALAGIVAAGAVLGKYWSLFLLIGLALAALLDMRRAAYFRSAAPWITIAAGLLVLGPHLMWLAMHDFTPLSYAVSMHGEKTLAESLHGAAAFIAGGVGYAAVPVLMVLALTRPSRAAVRDMLLPQAPERRFVAVTFWATLLLPVLFCVVSGFELSALWVMPALILMPVVLLSSPLLMVSRQAMIPIVAFAMALPPVMLAASPAIAVAIHFAGVSPSAAHARLLADRIAEEWRRITDRPLRIVGGDFDLSYMTAFYLPGPPAAFPVIEPGKAPEVTPERLAHEGAALACFMFYDRRDGQVCRYEDINWQIDNIASRVPTARRIETVITRPFFGIAGEPARYLITIVPPRP
jgi:4-amino-4-deoxy-L-arabinose transferase-like glycosyltransferase